VEVVTPGSAVSDKILDEGRNNYIAAITILDNKAGALEFCCSIF